MVEGLYWAASVFTPAMASAHVILVKKPAAAQAALWPWIERAAKRMAHRNLLATALANKLARIAWAVLARGHSYRPIANLHSVTRCSGPP